MCARRWWHHVVVTTGLGVVLAGELPAQKPTSEEEAAFRERGARLSPVQQYALGARYSLGDGVLQDYSEAARWYRLAAEQGLAAAQAMLGGMYRSGLGVPQDFARSVRWTRLAAAQEDANAQLALGAAYRDGLGVPENREIAHMWLNLAVANADRGAHGFHQSVGIKSTWENALDARRALEARMTRAQIAAAQQRATACQQSGYREC